MSRFKVNITQYRISPIEHKFESGDLVLDDEDNLFQVTRVRANEIALTDEPYYVPAKEYRLKEEEDVETLFEQSSQSISSELSDSSNTSDIGLPNINNFKDFGFTGDFEGEILKEVDEYYIGYIKWDDNIYTCCWTEPGNCEMTLMEKGSSFDTCSAWQSEYNLTPIKKEWYENPDNFPCLITIESGGMVLVHYQVDGISYDYRDNSYNLINGSWKLATKAELMSLYYKEE